MNVICPNNAVHVEQMNNAAQSYSNDELTVEYAALFVGPFELEATPYGSVYLEDSGRIMGDTTMETMELYQNAGLNLAPETKEPADHIAIELEFMHFLGSSIVNTLQQDDGEKAHSLFMIQQKFIRDYLGQWVVPFCGLIKKNSKNNFYLALANCLETFLSEAAMAEQSPAYAS